MLSFASLLGPDSEVPQDRFESAIAMPRQDLSRTHLAHHELESGIIIIVIIVIAMPNLQKVSCLSYF